MESNRHITISDFPQDDVAFMTKEYTTTITNSYLVAGRTIDLSYQTASMPSFGTTGSSYQFQVVTGDVPPPLPPYVAPPYSAPSNSVDLLRKPVFLFFNQTNQPYLYSMDNFAINPSWSGWTYAGIQFYGYANAAVDSSAVPVYQFYNAANNCFFYAYDQN